MNAVVPSGKPINFEITAYDGTTTLFAAMKIYDLSSGTATLVTTVGMVSVLSGCYWASYSFSVAQAGKSFLVIKAFYTDATYATLNAAYASGSEIVGPVDGFDQDYGRAT